MSFDAPEDLYYVETHEWLRVDGDRGTVGITDFAQDELGDIIFVELPEVGTALDQGEEFGTIESMKADAELYAPVSGVVTSANGEVTDYPGLVNEDPYGEGWMLRLEIADGHDISRLLNAEEYRNRTV